MRNALLYKVKDKSIQCRLCSHFCDIKENETGFCKVRKNEQQKLYSMVYGKVAAINIDPIEKKPLYHFLPASNILSIGTNGCNFKCRCCQNYTLAHEFKKIFGDSISPISLVEIAKKNQSKSIAYTYNEPTVFIEYVLDSAKLAKQNAIKNVLVTNGYYSKYAINELKENIDATNIDLKCFDDKKYQLHTSARLKPILNNIIEFKKFAWLELTTLIIPEFNDDEKQILGIIHFIKKYLGKEQVWHLSAFFPSYKMSNFKPTSNEILMEAYNLAKENGLENVYIGNRNFNNDTICQKCKKVLIKRNGYGIQNLSNFGTCPDCKTKIVGVYE